MYICELAGERGFVIIYKNSLIWRVVVKGCAIVISCAQRDKLSNSFGL